MDIFALVSALLGSSVLILTTLSQLELWQRKEYRLDRLRSFLRSPELSRVFFPWLAIATIFAPVGWLLSLTGQAPFAQAAGHISLLAFVTYHGIRIIKRGIFRPVFTAKAISIAIISLAAAMLLALSFSVFGGVSMLNWATLILLTPIIVALAVGIMAVPAAIRKRQIIRAAHLRRRQLPDLTVIGITGSYGKTSTKHYLDQLLKLTGLPTEATLEHRNSEVTVAQDILARLKKEHQRYIVEMGAYRRGEISALGRLTQPTIGIITAIGNQHIELFGSRENILRAKWELIESLPASGSAILNADEPLLIQEAKKTLFSGKILWFSRERPADIWADEINYEPERIVTTLHIGNYKQKVTIPLLSEASLGNVLAALAAATALGVPHQKLFEAVAQLKPFPRTLALIRGKNGAKILDDSYSASEAAVLAAIKHLARFAESDKRVVLLPIIELGSEAASVHYRIGRALAEMKSAVIYINGNAYQKAIKQGFADAGGTRSIMWINSPAKLAAKISQDVTKNSVILLEGRVPSIVRDVLL